MTSRFREAVSWENAAVAFLFLVGLLLRLRQYLTGRSLWADEAMLALNIVERDFRGMFRLLDYDQGAPIGFLLVEKFFNFILGKHEFVLRLFPFLVGLVSLWLFYLLLKRTMISSAGLLTGLALLVFNPRLVYYSSEVKQYILDVAVTIALLLIAAPVFNPSPRKKDFVWLALAGVIALWFSHPALFVLAGLGLTLLIVSLMRREPSSLRSVIGMGLLWGLNTGFLYFLILDDLSRNAYMREYWQGAFLPVPPWSDPGWIMRSIDENISIQFGVPYVVLFVFALMLAGWVVLFLHNRNYGIAVVCILLVTLAASALQLYPVFERMILFLVPVGIILLAKAVEGIYLRLQNSRVMSIPAAVVLAGFLLYGPVVTSIESFITPKYFEHIRPTMEHLRNSWKDGDALFVSNGALPAFRYYAPFYGLENISYESGKREDYQTPQNIASQLETFDGQSRVWILFSHVYEKGDFDEREFILDYLNQTGERKREFRVPGTSVFLYLYDLRN
jgi:hypothetical protein